LRATAEELQAADGDGRDRQNTSYREAHVEGKETPHGAQRSARDETGYR
jgi:hypothetical protein